MILLTNNEGTVGVPTTARRLAENAPALDAIEAGIRLIEADPSVRTVGRGGWPNLLCQMELDACVMDGDTLRSGAVGALQGFLHPVSVAREVMRRLPHELLVGDGAARFAREIGAEHGGEPDRGFPPRLAGLVRCRTVRGDRSATGRRFRWPRCAGTRSTRKRWGEAGQDTTVFLAQDAHGLDRQRHQHLRLGLEVSRAAGRQPDRRRRAPMPTPATARRPAPAPAR